MQSHLRVKALILLVSLVLLSSCSLFQANSTTPSRISTTAATIISPSPTFKVQSLPSLSSPTATASPVTTPIPIPSPRPTLTFVPRPSPEEGEKQFLELLHNNGNCRLPCWFGFTPGQTDR